MYILRCRGVRGQGAGADPAAASGAGGKHAAHASRRASSGGGQRAHQRQEADRAGLGQLHLLDLVVVIIAGWHAQQRAPVGVSAGRCGPQQQRYHTKRCAAAAGTGAAAAGRRDRCPRAHALDRRRGGCQRAGSRAAAGSAPQRAAERQQRCSACRGAPPLRGARPPLPLARALSRTFDTTCPMAAAPWGWPAAWLLGWKPRQITPVG